MKVDANYWRRAVRIGKQIYRAQAAGAVDEQAGPAYFAGLWLSRQLFWRRLSRSVAAIPVGERRVCLDFGCGFGLLLPLWRKNFAHVVGVDLQPELAQQFNAGWDREMGDPVGAGQGRLSIVVKLEQAELAAGSVDLILALDVLEHIADRSALLEEFARLLSPTGTLVVSGPSESYCYRLGRRIVGFSGDYHVCNVYDIEREMLSYFQIQRMTPVPRFPVLFEILVASHRRSALRVE